MRFEEYLKERTEDAVTEAVAEAKETEQKKMLLLIQYMAQDQLSDEIFRLSQEPDFLQSMLEKYSL